MSLIHGLLGLLNYSDMTGYELAKTFDDSLCYFWQAQTSQIYRELNKMEEMGFLSSHIEMQTEKPNKRVYTITAAGKTELQHWLNSDMPVEMMPTRSEVLLRLFFSSARTPEENIKAMKQLVDIYQKRVPVLNNTAQIIDEYKTFAHTDNDALYWELTADFRRAYNSMCLEWANRCIKRLEESQT